MRMVRKNGLLWLFSFVLLFLSGCQDNQSHSSEFAKAAVRQIEIEGSSVSASEVPEYDGEPYVVVNENEPEFVKEDLTSEAFEAYGELDELGRCTVAEASVGKELMPTEKRGSIGQVKPTGWHLVKYDNVDGKYLYNRCHLIGYQLTAENANEKNLITGTRYMNVEGMLPFENMVADYVKETGNHVRYRVTPVYEGENLLASGVQMEAESVEDDGEGVRYNVFVYNVQPEIEIDYATGESQKADEKPESDDASRETVYVINKNTKKFHKPSCASVTDAKARNKKETDETKEELVSKGYKPCQRCNP